ncbi:MAG: hypothetical protein M3R26_01590 [Actinomycetota bacterium]|nr:hypothetical protein [Actinomycetota bacterium]
MVEPDSKGGLAESLSAEVREVERKVFAPTQRHEHSMNVCAGLRSSSGAS